MISKGGGSWGTIRRYRSGGSEGVLPVRLDPGRLDDSWSLQRQLAAGFQGFLSKCEEIAQAQIATRRPTNQKLQSNVIISQEENLQLRRIYPQPELSWSTIPPSNPVLQNRTTVQQTEEQLYNISSSLTVVLIGSTAAPSELSVTGKNFSYCFDGWNNNPLLSVGLFWDELRLEIQPPSDHPEQDGVQPHGVREVEEPGEGGFRTWTADSAEFISRSGGTLQL
ncbi:hypothetical protein AMECASPLE_035445 [Ameca splendens]|uniref:Uncharacterized protein n=1 Tax=Ameca splendens TaxID=208324 RepID=A0ABV0Y7C1_9TELE